MNRNVRPLPEESFPTAAKSNDCTKSIPNHSIRIRFIYQDMNLCVQLTRPYPPSNTFGNFILSNISFLLYMFRIYGTLLCGAGEARTAIGGVRLTE